MPHRLQAHYLNIEWVGPGRAREITIAPEPIEIDEEDDGTMLAETQVFNGLCPWVGLRLGSELADAQPVFEKPDGSMQPMLQIEDSHGEHWWVQNDGWDVAGKRHLSELHRSMGQFSVLIGTRKLLINNVVNQLSRVAIEDYLHDFQQDLIWLVMGFGGATSSVSGGVMVNQEMVDALISFSTASRAVLAHPAHHVQEVQVQSRPARVRPNVATFRQYLRNPAAHRLTGRGVEETANIADNRYLRHMVQVCEKLSSKIADSADRHALRFTDRARVEAERSDTYQCMTHSQVDPVAFDNQLADLEKKLARVADFHNASPVPGEQVKNWEFKPGSPYAGRPNQMFYNHKDGSKTSDASIGIAYSVLQIPTALAEAIQITQSFCDYYSLLGVGRATRKSTKPKKGAGDTEEKGRLYREVVFDHIYGITPVTSAITRKAGKRTQLEKNNWLTPLNSKERQELQQEAKTARLRQRVYQDRGTQAHQTSKTLSQCKAELHAQDLDWDRLGVASSSVTPMGVRFSQSPAYTACQAAFAKVEALGQSNGVGIHALDAIERIGILHASALYERWCLVKIISILMEDYLFHPETGWQERLVNAISGKPQSVKLEFRRENLGMSACLEVQPVLPNGRRPDFRLRFSYDAATSSLASEGESKWGGSFDKFDGQNAQLDGLVMDAKFRTHWRKGELGRMLKSLIDEKGYDQENDRVFILHPAPRSILKPISPLAWGKDCDYGQEAGNEHRKGVVYLAPGIGESRPESHLRRLIVMQLQATFAEPVEVSIEGKKMWRSSSFCVRCGSAHQPEDINSHLTGRGNLFWTLSCSECGMQVTRTHCFGCKSGTLFKNGLNLTYHKTVADQVTNIVCPHCGQYFDSDVHGKQKNS